MLQKPPLYTPIIIEFLSAIESPDFYVHPVYQTYAIKIDCLASSKFGTSQILPQHYVMQIPSTGIIKLKLIGSTVDIPKIRYRVKYYGDGDLLDEQYWVIPSCPPLTSYPFEVIDGVGVIPKNTWAIDSITPNVEYTVEEFNLYTDIDGEYVITYQPGLTLDEIVIDG